jgi:hypothetical protein
MHADGGAGKALFFDDGEEGLKLVKVHRGKPNQVLAASMNQIYVNAKNYKFAL